MPEEQSGIVDWMNLPHGVPEVSLWAGLHDAQIVSIQSNLLERTVTLHLESDHLLEFHNLPLDMQFLLRLDGVQSARVIHYAVWPGEFSVPAGATREEEARLIAEYQSKWREESLSWSELENAVTTQCQQVIDIADATLATSADNSVALRISGLPELRVLPRTILACRAAHAYQRRWPRLGNCWAPENGRGLLGCVRTPEERG